LLTGERGHYELAASRDAKPYLRALEQFASSTGMLTEQVWDEPDYPQAYLRFGRPTGAAMPLMWAHAEYVKLLRSVHDGQPFDLIPEVAARYLSDRKACRPLEIWSANFPVRSIQRGQTLRIQASAPFRLHCSQNGWDTTQDLLSTSTALGIDYVDLTPRHSLCFTFFWTADGRWEGVDYEVAVEG
jgi:glucoamylase